MTARSTLTRSLARPAANISTCGKFRYNLTRDWSESPTTPIALWVMLNPSTADHEMDDPTIRRCVDFSKRFECGRLEVVNLFAYRASDPAELYEDEDLAKSTHNDVDNQRAVFEAVERCTASGGRIIVAWGAEKIATQSAIPKYVLGTVFSNTLELWCLGTTKSRAPKHPLYIKAETPLERWRPW